MIAPLLRSYPLSISTRDLPILIRTVQRRGSMHSSLYILGSRRNSRIGIDGAGEIGSSGGFEW